MNDYLVSILLGIIEGLTEFLPVSSTAHLRIAQGWLGIDLESGYWKMYAIVIQLGAILSVVTIFWRRSIELRRSFPGGPDGKQKWWSHPLALVIIAFVITAGPCFAADEFIGENLEDLRFIALALLLGGIAMWVIDVLFSRPRCTAMEQMTLVDAIWIGAAQILSAMFPGTSRSMVTIGAGQMRGMSRHAALEFSFFLSVPTMIAATLFKLAQAMKHQPRTAEEFAKYGAPNQPWIILLIGFVVSFIVALFVNRWFLSWVRKHGFVPFAVYRIVLGLFILLLAWRGFIH